jgi:predicted dithiol-disulfide oxidoreductase (DUF899 family)
MSVPQRLGGKEDRRKGGPMRTETMNQAAVVSRHEWRPARRQLLTKEKEVTRHRDEVNAERRRLAMVEITRTRSSKGQRQPA